MSMAPIRSDLARLAVTGALVAAPRRRRSWAAALEWALTLIATGVAGIVCAIGIVW